MRPAHIAAILGGNSAKKKSQKINKHSWCLPRGDVEKFVHHPWEEEPMPEPDGIPNGLLVSTNTITYRSLTVCPT